MIVVCNMTCYQISLIDTFFKFRFTSEKVSVCLLCSQNAADVIFILLYFVLLIVVCCLCQ